MYYYYYYYPDTCISIKLLSSCFISRCICSSEPISMWMLASSSWPSCWERCSVNAAISCTPPACPPLRLSSSFSSFSRSSCSFSVSSWYSSAQHEYSVISMIMHNKMFQFHCSTVHVKIHVTMILDIVGTQILYSVASEMGRGQVGLVPPPPTFQKGGAQSPLT